MQHHIQDIWVQDQYQFQHNKRLHINDPLSLPIPLNINWKSSMTQIILSKKKININLPALRGRGTPPTKTVFLGSNGMEASSTKSASLNLHGLICTGLSLIVGLETHKYNLSSSWIQASISAWTDDSSWNSKNA